MQSLFKEYQKVFEGKEELQPKSVAKESFGKSDFALPDAVGRKSAKDAWMEYMKQLGKGAVVEMIHGAIVSKVRGMLLADAASLDELDLHPFVYKKAKLDMKNWNREELQKFYNKLVFMYHDARRIGLDLQIELEKAFLSMGSPKDKTNPPKIV
ncbi:MAG: hypothetical protein AAB392_02120 [Patescibacteria group bacterium]